ncbi:MAG: tRNA (guanosine(37)-N1)-methyltransferase TrmD [Pseudomonadales bacterium]|nr:tRNA (guanosine(37)-N1)-methyltransferase TrmD [Pseudomonadales bacterium]
MWIGVISLFPEMFDAVIKHGITGRAINDKLMTLELWNPRDFTQDKHQTVDDRPYGGGPGMVMKYSPLKDAIVAAKRAAIDSAALKDVTESEKALVIYLSPQGRRLDQQGVEELAQRKQIILVAGRYEGVDERLIQDEVDEEWSVGDFVLTGGELPAMTLVDSICRLIPGALGHIDSAAEDSFSSGLLDFPHYTRPETVAEKSVPSVLLSGNHEKIRLWRLKQALGRTWQRRPDLLEGKELTKEEKCLLSEFINERE